MILGAVPGGTADSPHLTLGSLRGYVLIHISGQKFVTGIRSVHCMGKADVLESDHRESRTRLDPASGPRP
jgi:hypothetical protein